MLTFRITIGRKSDIMASVSPIQQAAYARAIWTVLRRRHGAVTSLQLARTHRPSADPRRRDRPPSHCRRRRLVRLVRLLPARAVVNGGGSRDGGTEHNAKMRGSGYVTEAPESPSAGVPCTMCICAQSHLKRRSDKSNRVAIEFKLALSIWIQGKLETI